MWYKVKEYSSKDLSIVQISRLTGLHRQTVSKYLKMSEAEFVASQTYRRNYAHKLDRYEDFVADELRNPAGLSAAQIEDHLRQKPDYDRSTCSKTVFNFVQYVRRKYNILQPSSERSRQFEKLAETLPGEYAQVDFGEKYMTRDDGSGAHKVYFFAMSLSYSRHKFIFFRDHPFTTAWTVYAHHKAFEFYGGVPQKIIYDQDKVLLVSENHGDYIYTHGFRALVAEVGFTPVFCRKSDPQSKGKIENVVKYVKNNFVKGRTFTNVETLNSEAIAWLERTGNGSLHHGIHRIPADVFVDEQPSLQPYGRVAVEPEQEIRRYKVRKDNTISYRSCFYALPIGTYQGQNTEVFVEESDERVIIYNVETGKMIISHPLSPEKGKLVSNGSTRRILDGTVADLRKKLIDYTGSTPGVEEYLDSMHKLKPRYFRDTLSTLLKKCASYTPQTMRSALETCRAKNIYNFRLLLDTIESIRQRNGELLKQNVAQSQASSHPEIDPPSLTPDKTDIHTYSALFTV
jgi:transposase